MLWAGQPFPVRRLVLYHQHERLVPIPVMVQPVQGLVGDNVRHIPLNPFPAGGGDEIGIIIIALAGQNGPRVKTGGVRHKMPLAEKGRLIAVLTQQFREGFLAAIEAAAVVPEPVEVAVQAGEHHRAAGAADGVRDKTVAEQGPIPGDTVDVRRGGRPGQPAAIGADGVLGMVVAIDPKNVRALLRVSRVRGGQGGGHGRGTGMLEERAA
ncbi:MAG: hypothetical protein BWY09_00978 [Candidatus Hydrogenedentes bacterium ADurb.Bin179]|nr:MAG: hypothetical protein BWY09_00978 [Candidatus Hydrogenedentes bacterium ADurb.Bin179]